MADRVARTGVAGFTSMPNLVTEALPVEAHEAPKTPVTTAVFSIGFLLLMLIEIAAE